QRSTPPVLVPNVVGAPTPVDAFVLDRLRKLVTAQPADNVQSSSAAQVGSDVEHVQLSPEADRYTLMRRATYDLLGLPPTPEEVAAFIEDREPGAYERMLERLLASPHYGERWGRHWLDVAGYADSE